MLRIVFMVSFSGLWVANASKGASAGTSGTTGGTSSGSSARDTVTFSSTANITALAKSKRDADFKVQP